MSTDSDAIYVGYRELGFGYHHKFLMYYKHPDQRWVASGWAQNAPELGSFFPTGSPPPGSMALVANYGNIVTRGGTSQPQPYDEDDYDYPLLRNGIRHPDRSFQFEEIVRGRDLSAKWRRVTDAIDAIGREGHEYRPMYQNSNSVVDEALRRAGLPRPTEDGFLDKWAPGSDRRLGPIDGGVDTSMTVLTFLQPQILYERITSDAGLTRLLSILRSVFAISENTISPLVLDLDGNGVTTLPMNSRRPVYFDHDANGFAELSGWVAPADALLVRDLDGNGKIDSGRELFGNETLLASGQRALHGFQALATLDTNDDGRVDRTEADAGAVRLWRDANGNGVTDAGELSSLADQGVLELPLAYVDTTLTDGQGNAHRQQGHYVNDAGEQRDMADVWFATERSISQDLNVVPLPPSFTLTVDLPGMGNLPSLRQAMARDSSGALAAAVQTWLDGDEAARRAVLPELLYRWAGVYDNNPRARTVTDARRLDTLEVVLGREYASTKNAPDGSPRAPRILASLVLERGWDLLVDYVDGQLRLQTDHRDHLKLVRPVFSIEKDCYDLDATALAERLAQDWASAEAQAPGSGDVALARFISSLIHLGMTGQAAFMALFEAVHLRPDVVPMIVYMAGTDRQVVAGTQGNDSPMQAQNKSLMLGFAGDDLIVGSTEPDGIVGGPGNDRLQGGGGADMYWFGAGHGQDRLSDYHVDRELGRPGAQVDQVMICNSLDAVFPTLTRLNNDLTLRFGEDRLTIERYFENAGYRPRIRFMNGTEWSETVVASLVEVEARETADQVRGLPNASNRMSTGGGDDRLEGGLMADELHGGDGNDVAVGGEGADWVDGGAGADSLYGEAGNDLLFGGAGDDNIIGGPGHDLHFYRPGDGHDSLSDYAARPGDVNVLLLAPGLSPSQTQVSRIANNVRLGWGTDDSVVLYQQLQHPGRFGVDQVVFSDGTVWDRAGLRARLMSREAQLHESRSAADWSLPLTAAGDVTPATAQDDVFAQQAWLQTLLTEPAHAAWSARLPEMVYGLAA